MCGRRYCLNLAPVLPGILELMYGRVGATSRYNILGKFVRKSDGPEQIELIIKTMMKYGVDGREKRVRNDENSARL